ncbi:exo-alpha-sialidase [Muricauda sp. CAU 1633]|uniref:sialidase family protein n=1 Tax=Allomuricauda sp. CAU 1633 TaxID=2816036 RepID=UPI001A8E0CD1|nr:sialidase family protein [Muricauda sp. CAU 1633]MBO0323003.1 exo-alpha-sialidase [Muricauda sp. CAU 1633]
MGTRSKIYISGFLFVLLGCLGKAQTIPEFVSLDSSKDAFPGKNIAIPSQFETYPIVEPTIASHPSDNDHLLAAAMVVTNSNDPYQSCRLSSFVSKDGGETWKETAHDYWGYDPWVALLPNGKTALSWLGTPKSFKSQFPLAVFTSNDGGENWDSNVQVFQGLGHGHDGTKLVGSKDAFYLTTVRFNANMGADVVLYESISNRGFKEVGAIEGQGRRLNFCEPAILTNGTVVVPTMHGQGKIWANVYNPETQEISETYIVSNNPRLGRGYSRMASDIGKNSDFTDRIYFVRAVADGTRSQGVWLNYSKDEGKTWTPEKRIDLFENKRPSKANVASVAVNKNGVVGISWVDGQFTEDQKSYDVFFSISKDGGERFQRPIRITEVSSNPRTNENGDVANKFIGGGHYLGITAKPDGSFQLIWSDSRTGMFKLQTCNVKIK